MTALHMAAQEGNVEVVRLLTEAEAHVSIQTEVQTCTYILRKIKRRNNTNPKLFPKEK